MIVWGILHCYATPCFIWVVSGPKERGAFYTAFGMGRQVASKHVFPENK